MTTPADIIEERLSALADVYLSEETLLRQIQEAYEAHRADGGSANDLSTVKKYRTWAGRDNRGRVSWQVLAVWIKEVGRHEPQ